MQHNVKDYGLMIFQEDSDLNLIIGFTDVSQKKKIKLPHLNKNQSA